MVHNTNGYGDEEASKISKPGILDKVAQKFKSAYQHVKNGIFYGKFMDDVESNQIKNIKFANESDRDEFIKNMNSLSDGSIEFSSDSEGNLIFTEYGNRENKNKKSNQLLRELNESILNSDKEISIKKGIVSKTWPAGKASDWHKISDGTGLGSDIFINKNSDFTKVIGTGNKIETKAIDKNITLAHELIHAVNHAKGRNQIDSDKSPIYYKNWNGKIEAMKNREEAYTLDDGKTIEFFSDKNGTNRIYHPRESYVNRILNFFGIKDFSTVTENDIRKEHRIPLRVTYDDIDPVTGQKKVVK